MASSGFISRPITAIKTCLRNLILLLLRNFFFLVFVSWFAVINKKKGGGVRSIRETMDLGKSKDEN